MTANELRNELLTLLADIVGTYKNGVPSVWVSGAGNNPPSSSNGLEILISHIPTGDPRSSSSGQRYHPRLWELTLKNWTATPNLDLAVGRIRKVFTTSRFTNTPADEKVIEQTRIYITDRVMI
jgi:hypothetical protein